MNKKKTKWRRISTHLYENMVGQFMVCFTRFIFPRSTQNDVHAFDLFMCEIGYGLIMFYYSRFLTRNWFTIQKKKYQRTCDVTNWRWTSSLWTGLILWRFVLLNLNFFYVNEQRSSLKFFVAQRYETGEWSYRYLNKKNKCRATVPYRLFLDISSKFNYFVAKI